MPSFRPTTFLIIAGAAGTAAIAAGAFAAHGLEAARGSHAVSLWSLASQYQLVHALALVGVAILMDRQPSRLLTLAGLAFTLGMTLFCGALYLLGWWGPSLLGAVAPVGGLCLMAGWAMLALYGIAQRRRP